MRVQVQYENKRGCATETTRLKYGASRLARPVFRCAGAFDG